MAQRSVECLDRQQTTVPMETTRHEAVQSWCPSILFWRNTSLICTGLIRLLKAIATHGAIGKFIPKGSGQARFLYTAIDW